MAFIEEASENDAAVAAHFDADRERLGRVANSSRVFARRPEVYDAWKTLIGAVRANMDPRRYELTTIAAARTLRSSYCMLAHADVLVEAHYDSDALLEIVHDHRAAGLDAADVAIMDFAEQVARDATSVTPRDVDRLREHGLSDDEILDVVLTAAVRSFFSKTLDATGAQPDRELGERFEPELRDALTPGRPIADG